MGIQASVALSQDIDIEPGPVCGGKGEKVTFTVVISNAPNEEEGFGFDVIGCKDILNYLSYTRAASGSVVNLQFEVVAASDCCLDIENMVDDI